MNVGLKNMKNKTRSLYRKGDVRLFAKIRVMVMRNVKRLIR